MTDIEAIKPLKHIGTVELKTQRLILRKFRKSDGNDMFNFAGNPNVTKYLSYETHKRVRDSKRVLKDWVHGYKNICTYNWAIEYDGKVIGCINVVGQENLYQCHLGWQIDEPYWGKGIMSEAALAVVDFLFGVVGYDKISARHDIRNVGSGRVMEKIGMTVEGVVKRSYFQKDGSIGDQRLLGILRSDWEKSR